MKNSTLLRFLPKGASTDTGAGTRRRKISDFLPRLWLAAMLLAGALATSRAEGTRQVAPSPTDIVMLLTGRPDFSNFASFDGPEDSRLYISVNHPGEVIYLGLSAEYDENGRPFTNLLNSRYRFRIRRFTGTGVDPIVHGPYTIDNLNANVRSWADAEFGVYDLSYTVSGVRVYEFQPGQAGDYYIEFQDIGNDGSPFVHIGFWDITVARDGAPINGRVWSRNWAFRTPTQDGTVFPDCGWDRPFNGALYSYTSDGFVSKIDFKDSGFQGLAFTVAFNTTGPGASGDASLDRMSIPRTNATGNAAEHRIFLHEPDPLVFPDGECGSVSAASMFRCTENGFCLDVTVTRPGQVEIILDFNQNGQFDPDSEDVSLIWCFDNGKPLTACVPWDGRKGNGEFFNSGDVVDLILVYTQGVQHWATYDAEFLKNGFCVQAVRPLCNGGATIDVNRLYWDDRNIPLESGTNQPKDGRNGCLCRTDGCRTWTNFNPNTPCDRLNDNLTAGYGDKNTLNTWWFANLVSQSTANVPLIACTVSGRDSICQGETSEFFVDVTVRNGGNRYQWSGPGGFNAEGPSTGPISAPGVYTVTAVDDSGCRVECSLELFVFQPPALSVLVAVDESCPGANDGGFTITATGGAGNYAYSLDGENFQNFATFAGLPAGDYTATVRDAAGCLSVIDVFIAAGEFPQADYPDTLLSCGAEGVRAPLPAGAEGLFFAWTPAESVDDPSSATPLLQPESTTTYFVAISKNELGACQITDTVTVIVAPPLNLRVEGDTLFCAPTTAELQAAADRPVTFTWFDENGAPLATGANLSVELAGRLQVSVRAEDENGCVEEISVSLVEAEIQVELPQLVAVCTGEDIVVEAINTRPEQALSYAWSPAALIVPGTENTPNPGIIPQVGENYIYVDIVNQYGCVYRDSVLIVVVDSDLEIDFSSLIGCDGVTVEFTNNSSNAFGFIWNFGDPNNPGAGSTEPNPTYTYSQAGTYTVTLTIRYAVSCADTATQTLEIGELQLRAAYTYMLEACTPEGARVAFAEVSESALGDIVEREWTFIPGGTFSEPNPVITIEESGNLIVTLSVVSEDGCEASLTDTLRVLIARLDLADTLILCPGDSVALNPGGDPSLSYSWTPAEGLDDPNAATPLAAPAATTTYTVLAGGAGDIVCEAGGQVTVLVGEPLRLRVDGDTTSCGEPLTLRAQTEAPADFVWTDSQGAIVGQGPLLTVTPPFGQTTYTVTATSAENCSESVSITVYNRGVNVALRTPDGDLTACEPLEFTAELENLNPDDELTVQWSPAEFVSDPTSLTPLIRVESGEVLFSVALVNQFECVDTLRFRVTIQPFDPMLPDTVIVCAGESKALAPEANPDYQYSWFPATGLDDPNSGNPVFSGEESIVYTVTVTGDSNGTACEVVKTVEVTVRPAIGLQASGDTTLCGPSLLTLLASAAADNVTFTWFDGPSLVDSIGAGPEIILTPPIGTTIYYVLAMDEVGCTELDFVEVIVADIPQMPFEPVVNACPGVPTPINPNNANPNLVYEWSPSEGLDLSDPSNPIATLDSDATYGVTATDTLTGCVIVGEVMVMVNPPIELSVSGDTTLCEPESVMLGAEVAGEGVVIRWYDNREGGGEPLAEGPTFTFVPTLGVNVRYAIADDGAGCTEIDSAAVVVLPPFDSGLPSVLTVCAEAPTSINLNPDLSYQWSPDTGLDLSDPANPVITLSEDQTYQVTVTNPATGCEKVETLAVTVAPELTLEISPADTVVCPGESVSFTAVVNVPAQIEWFDNPAFSGDPIATGATLTVTPGLGTTTYYARARGEDACNLEATASVSVTVPDVLSDSGLPNLTLQACPGQLIPLLLNDAYTYEWTPVTGLDFSTPGAVIITAIESVVYTVIVTDIASGCSAQAQVALEVFPPVRVSVTPGPDVTLCEPQSLTLSAIASTPAQISWFDNPALAGPPLGVGPQLTIDPPLGQSVYYVLAIATEGCLSRDTASVTVTVFDLPTESLLPDSALIVCENTPITLPLNPDLTYTWTPDTGLDLSDPSQVVIVAAQDIVYQVRVEDPATGCAIEREVALTVTPRPSLVTSPDTLLCEPAPLTLFAFSEEGARIEWHDNPEYSGEPLAVGESFTVTPPMGTTIYYVRAFIDEDCPAEAEIRVNVNNLVDLSGLPGAPLRTCAGDPVRLSLNPAFTYTWSPETGLDLSDPANPVITVSENTTYSVTIVDPASGCEAEAEVEVEASPNVVLMLMPDGDTTLCEIKPITLNASTEGPADIAWYDNAELSGEPLATGGALTVTPPPGVTTYHVTATGTGACLKNDTAAITVTVFDLPGESGLPDSTLQVCAGAEITLELNPDYTYQWDPTTGLDLSDPNRPVITVEDDIVYSVRISDEATGCQVETEVSIMVSPPIDLRLSPRDTILCEPDMLTLTATTAAPADIRWYDNPDFAGEPLAEGGLYTIVPPLGRTVLYVLAVSTGECEGSERDSAVVNVFDVPIESGIPDSTLMACPGDTVRLTLNPDLEYEWGSTEGVDLSDPNRPLISVTAPRVFKIRVLDPNTNCEAEVELSVAPFPPIDLRLSNGIDTLLCGPREVNLSAFTNRAATITWYDGPDFTQPEIGGGNVLPVIPPAGKTTYYAVAESPEGCVEVDSITINVKDLIDESGLSDLPDTTLAICAGTPTPLPLNPAFQYEWSPLDEGIDAGDPSRPIFTLDSSRVYTVVITDTLSGCVDSAELRVLVNPPLELAAGPDTTLCAPAPVTMMATTSQPANFEWSDSRSFETILGRDSILTVTPQAQGANLYYVRATDTTALACTQIDSVLINIFAIDAELPSLTLCEPASSAELMVINRDANQTLTYIWLPMEAIISDPDEGPGATVNLDASREFSVLLENQFGCTDSLSAAVTVIDLPGTLEIAATPASILPGESSQLTVTGCEDCTYEWSPSNTLDRDDIANPVARPSETTTYSVRVSKDGCETTLSVTVTVEDFLCGFPYIFVPNAFTPNGDGVNDVLFVRGRNITSMRLIIYNRWGQKVFETTSQEVGWDGTFRGRPLPPDVYAYYLEVVCGDGETYTTKGNVTLLR
jgi:gliding motility-associated-like protein